MMIDLKGCVLFLLAVVVGGFLLYAGISEIVRWVS